MKEFLTLFQVSFLSSFIIFRNTMLIYSKHFHFCLLWTL